MTASRSGLTRRMAFGVLAGLGASGSASASSRTRRARQRARDEAEAESRDKGWRDLWNNEDLSGFETWLGIPPPEFAGLDIPRTVDGKYREPMGLDRDPRGVFSVVTNADGRRLLRISGEMPGAITTKETLSNYHLRLDWQWGRRKWPPRAHLKRKSAVVYHATGAHGSGDAMRSCMRGLGCQLKEGDTGDLISFGMRADVPAQVDRFMGKPVLVFRPASRLAPFPHAGFDPRVVKYEDHERASGEWNQLDLFVLGGESLHVVNGSLDLRAFNARLIGQAGQETPMTEGRVQLLSEGAEILMRRISVRPIAEFPERFARIGTRHKDDEEQPLEPGNGEE